MSENTINAALRTMGYDTQEQITGHGFWATARTLIREHLGWAPDVIERHLAHVSDEELGGSYDRATFLAQRKEMVQQWADFLDSLEEGKMPVRDENVMRFVRSTAKETKSRGGSSTTSRSSQPRGRAHPDRDSVSAT